MLNDQLKKQYSFKCSLNGLKYGVVNTFSAFCLLDGARLEKRVKRMGYNEIFYLPTK